MDKPHWLDQLLIEMDWTPADLSRASGLDSAVISNIRNSKRGVGPSTARKIAKATNHPPEDILRMAGELPSKSPENKTVRQITYLTDQLPPEEQQGILEFVKLRLRLSEDKGKNETRKTPRSASSPKRS